jgi:hypothetical protein
VTTESQLYAPTGILIATWQDLLGTSVIGICAAAAPPPPAAFFFL